MKRKLLFTLMLVALTVMLFAVSVSADDLVIGVDDIESASATATKLKDPITLFDDVIDVKGGWYSGGWNGWTAPANAVATIVFKEEFAIKSAYLYVWTNDCPGATFKFFDSTGKETYSTYIGGGFGSFDGEPISLAWSENPVKAKSMTITMHAAKYEGFGFSMGELDLYAEHSCTFTIPGDIVLEPTCAMDGEQEYFCKCGESQNELIPATGNHSISERVVYRDGFNYPGIIASACATCATQDEKIDDVPAMFKSLGYSASEFGKNGVTHGVFVDWDAIATFNEYADKNGDAYIDFGMVAGARSAFAEGNPLTITSDGVGVASNVLSFKSFADTDASLISYSLNGFGDMYKDTQLIVSAYIYDGNEIYYLSGDDCYTEVSTVSYNEVLDIAAPPVIEATVKEN